MRRALALLAACAAACLAAGGSGCGGEAPVGAAITKTLFPDTAKTSWLPGWELRQDVLVEKDDRMMEQMRGSEAVFDVELPLRPMIRGQARLRSGKNPYTQGVPIRGSVSIVVSAGGREQIVTEQAFAMPGEFFAFTWNEPLPDFEGQRVQVRLRMDPGPPDGGAPASHRRLRVEWKGLRIEGYRPAD